MSRDAAKERLKAKAAAKRKQLNKEEAYVSQEEVSEESDQSIEEKETSNLLTFGQFSERKELSIDDQMRISREAAAKRKPYKDEEIIKKALSNSRMLLRMQRKIQGQMLRR